MAADDGDLRRRILVAAIDLWIDKGAGFTMSELATSLRISKKTLYVEFDDKEDLLVQAVDHWFDAVKRAEREILDDPALSTIDKVRRVIVVQPPGHRTIAWADFAASALKHPRVHRRVLERLESGWEPTLDLLREGIDAGEIRPIDVDVARGVIEGAFERLLARPETSADWTRTLEAMIDLIVGGLAPRDAGDPADARPDPADARPDTAGARPDPGTRPDPVDAHEARGGETDDVHDPRDVREQGDDA